MLRCKCFWLLVAAVPLLAAGGWFGAHLTATASPAGTEADVTFDCCTEPTELSSCPLECGSPSRGKLMAPEQCCDDLPAASSCPANAPKSKTECPPCPNCP